MGSAWDARRANTGDVAPAACPLGENLLTVEGRWPAQALTISVSCQQHCVTLTVTYRAKIVTSRNSACALPCPLRPFASSSPPLWFVPGVSRSCLCSVLHELPGPKARISLLDFDPLDTQQGNVRGCRTANENKVQRPQASLLQNSSAGKGRIVYRIFRE